MRNRIEVFFIAAVVGISFLGSMGTAHAAFGISPPFLNTSHLVPGSTYTQTVYLVQDQPNVDLPIRATLTVPSAIQSWFSIDKGFNFTIPQGTRQFPVQVTITVPKNAGLGVYSGSLVFATAPGSAGQVTIALAVSVAINITVGDGVYESYSVPYITFPSIEEGWNPRATVRFQNNGNVPESFDSATFDLYDQYDSVRLAYITKNDGFPVTPAFTTDEYTIEFPTDFHLGVGDYWGDVTFYKNNQAIASEKTIFHVLPAGSLSSPMAVFFEDVEAYWAYCVAGLLILFVAVWRLFPIIFRRKK